ncbi:RNase adapter RapZ [Aestuariibius sp. 2305UL40-4]|uniref:RNase adapter RapZ n=1 Tax=Aestuariibius violaceus TaxID=3234132 RepID=UPI00345E70CB
MTETTRITLPDPDSRDPADLSVVLVTGPSGAGRSTAIAALEDTGFEVIDNLPLSLLNRLLEGPPLGRPLALGLDVRNRDFSTQRLTGLIDGLRADPGISAEVLYIDCSDEVLLRRYSETRRRHPMAPDASPLDGIRREGELLGPIRDRADILIDTSTLSPHDLRAEMNRWFAPESGQRMAISVQSFSYKRGLPRSVDLVFDCRFLRNPHWEADLRPLDGRAPEVAAFVTADPRFAAFDQHLKALLETLLPAYRDEGKAHLTIAFGCTGGQHRSVAVTERITATLAEQGWQVSSRHRELERRRESPTSGGNGAGQ